MQVLQANHRGTVLRVGTAAFVLVALMGFLATSLWSTQGSARRELRERFETRADMAAQFIETWAGQEMQASVRFATQNLRGDVDATSLDIAADALDFQAAVLLDADGRALAVWPRRADLIGVDLSARYDHLRAAVGGTPMVSNVTASAAEGKPVVALATPFDTPVGRRVLSVAHLVEDMPVSAFLSNASPIPGSEFRVVDGADVVLAASDTALELDAAADRVVSTYPVDRTPWHLVASVPERSLFAPLAGTSRVPWLLLLAFGAAGLAALYLFARVLTQRENLDVAGNSDPLTGLPNRMHAERELDVIASAARRNGRCFGVLVVDIDRFKQLNDTYGHRYGDVALWTVADRLRSAARGEDVVARWGGEEFVVFLREADAPSLAAAGERVRTAVESTSMPFGDGLTVTVSIGAAIGLFEEPMEVVHQADEALYRAKGSGRNQVQVATPELVPLG